MSTYISVSGQDHKSKNKKNKKKINFKMKDEYEFLDLFC
jgi:hypothetical protein